MIELKCKSCGGELILAPDGKTATCKYCASKVIVEDKKPEPPKNSAQRININIQTAPTETPEELLAKAWACIANFERAKGLFSKVVEARPKCGEAYLGLFLCDVRCPSYEQLEGMLTQRYQRAGSAAVLRQLENQVEGSKDAKNAIAYCKDARGEGLKSLFASLAAIRKERSGPLVYAEAKKDLERLDAAGQDWRETLGGKLPAGYKALAGTYKRLGSYEDAAQLESYCMRRYEELWSEWEAYEAKQKAEKAALEKAQKRKRKIRQFTLLAGSLAAVLALAYVVFLLPGKPLRDAGRLVSRGEYQQGIDAYLAIGGDEGNEMAEQTVSDWADALAEEGDHDGAIARVEEYIAARRDYPDNGILHSRLKQARLDAALTALEAKDYRGATEQLTLLGDPYYRESGQLLYHTGIAMLGQLEVGETVSFGVYRAEEGGFTPQYEALSWYVTAKEDGRTQLVGENILYCPGFKTEDARWQDTALYGWLNGDFYEYCFVQAEKDMLLGGVDTLTIQEFQQLPEEMRGRETSVRFRVQTTSTLGWWAAADMKSGEAVYYSLETGAGDSRADMNTTGIGVKPVVWVDNTVDWQDMLDWAMEAARHSEKDRNRVFSADNSFYLEWEVRDAVRGIVREHELPLEIESADTGGMHDFSLVVEGGKKGDMFKVTVPSGSYYFVECNLEEAFLRQPWQQSLAALIQMADPVMEFADCLALAETMVAEFEGGEKGPVYCVGSQTFFFTGSRTSAKLHVLLAEY